MERSYSNKIKLVGIFQAAQRRNLSEVMRGRRWTVQEAKKMMMMMMMRMMMMRMTTMTRCGGVGVEGVRWQWRLSGRLGSSRSIQLSCVSPPVQSQQSTSESTIYRHRELVNISTVNSLQAQEGVNII